MSRPSLAEPVKLIFSVLAAGTDTLNETVAKLALRFGRPDFISERMPFEYTDYYRQEMGETLSRRFLSIESCVCPESLPDIKHTTNRMEDESVSDGRRQVNIDPGYLSKAHLILATGKGYSHRPYLRDGIYADITLIYQAKAFQSLPWTYPDYADEKQKAMLIRIRQRYLLQLKMDALAH